MADNPWERIADLGHQIEVSAKLKINLGYIEAVATEILMQCVIIKDEEKKC